MAEALGYHTSNKPLYGDRLAHTVLFGSHARGEARPDSDVDVLVVLQGPLNTYEEIKRLVPVAMGLWERYGLDVQLTPFSAERYADDRHPPRDERPPGGPPAGAMTEPHVAERVGERPRDAMASQHELVQGQQALGACSEP